MTETLRLLLVTIQSLIFSALFNETISLVVKNPMNVEIKRKSKSDQFSEIQRYRDLENKNLKNEQIKNKAAADTLVMKSQMIPSKRFSENKGLETLKKNKREVVRVMNEEFPVYKTMRFIDEGPSAPIFSTEETMPKSHLNRFVPRESKKYLGIEYRINKVLKTSAKIREGGIQRILLRKQFE